MQQLIESLNQEFDLRSPLRPSSVASLAPPPRPPPPQAPAPGMAALLPMRGSAAGTLEPSLTEASSMTSEGEAATQSCGPGAAAAPPSSAMALRHRAISAASLCSSPCCAAACMGQNTQTPLLHPDCRRGGPLLCEAHRSRLC